jgi:hypothetical protein
LRAASRNHPLDFVARFSFRLRLFRVFLARPVQTVNPLADCWGERG